MTEGFEVKDIKDIMQNNKLNLCVKENNTYINIPKEILDKGMNKLQIILEYILVWKS